MTTDPVEILNRRNAEVAQIRGYADLTEEGKVRRIAEVQERAQLEYRQAVADREREMAERLERTRRAVFRVPIPATATDAEEAQTHAAYRQPTTTLTPLLAALRAGRRSKRSSSGTCNWPSVLATSSWPRPLTTALPPGGCLLR